MKFKLRMFAVLLTVSSAALLPLAVLAQTQQSEQSQSSQAATAEPADFAALVAKLPSADFQEKRAIVDQMVALHHPHTRVVLHAFLEGDLASRESDNKVFITKETQQGYALVDPLTESDAGTATSDAMDRIVVNNSLRKYLRGVVAQLSLTDPDAAVRLAAVREMQRNLDADTVTALRAHQKNETNAKVREAIGFDLAVADLDSNDANVRLKAIDVLQGSVDDDVYNRLNAMLQTDSDGKPVESDPRVVRAALHAVHTISRWRTFYHSIETLFFGLSLGSVLVLAAIGLAITFGVMGVINMAHGELMMLGAYTTYVVQQMMPNHIGASIFVAIPLAFIVSGLVGIVIERGVVRFLYGRPLETLLATFGVSLILQQVVRDIFTATNRPVDTPSWLAGSWQINDALSITYNRMYIVLFTAMVFAALLAILKRTTLGLNVRAVAQNRAMARAMGVRSEWVDAMTFGLGSGIAGIAGVALSQLTNVGPNLGQQYIVDSFMVVVFGGVGNLWGTLISGLSLGVVNKLLEPYSGAVLAKIFVLIFLILFIQRRPRGLFPQKGRAAEG